MKAKIIIEGKQVQDIGYRYYLSESALSFGIERFRALNTEDKKQVHVFVEGDDEGIQEFCNFVKSNHPKKAIVDHVKVEDYRGYVPKIEAFALIFNIGQSRKFIEAAQKVENSIKEESEKTRGVITEESEKTRGVIVEESGKTRGVIVEESEKTRGVITEESEKTRDELGGRIDLLRMDMKEFMETNMKRLYEEISEIKQALRKSGIM